MFQLTAAILGAGIIALPSVTLANGMILGLLLVFFGAILSYLAGMAIVRCTDITSEENLEDIGRVAFGRFMSYFTSVLL